MTWVSALGLGIASYGFINRIPGSTYLVFGGIGLAAVDQIGLGTVERANEPSKK